MPRNGSGVYTAPQNSWNPAVNGAGAQPADWMAILQDLVTAMTQSTSADGQTLITGVWNFGNNRITGVGAPVGAGNALRWEQMIKGPDIASAATISIPIEGSLFDVTGTTTITSFDDAFPGRFVLLRFADSLTLTNSATLKMPGGVNIFTRSNDVGLFVNVEAGVWECVYFSGAKDVTATSINGGQLAGQRNKIINGAFQINQRGYASGATTTAGQYTLDRWKVTGTGGVTYSTSNGKTTVTIPSGQTLQQVIEGVNLPAGDYVLSWEGTAQGRIDGGSYGDSGQVTVSLTGGVSATVEFNDGTLSNVQLEPGTIPMPFEHRFPSFELDLCYRYFQRIPGPLIFQRAALANTDFHCVLQLMYLRTMRAIPTRQMGSLLNGTSLALQDETNVYTRWGALATSSSSVVQFSGPALFDAEL